MQAPLATVEVVVPKTASKAPLRWKRQPPRIVLPRYGRRSEVIDLKKKDIETRNGTLVVGDLHCKQAEMLPRISAVAKERGARSIVLLGDYTDEWGSTADDVLNALDFQIGWLEEQTADGMNVTCLVGNHDFEYLIGVAAAPARTTRRSSKSATSCGNRNASRSMCRWVFARTCRAHAGMERREPTWMRRCKGVRHAHQRVLLRWQLPLPRKALVVGWPGAATECQDRCGPISRSYAMTQRRASTKSSGIRRSHMRENRRHQRDHLAMRHPLPHDKQPAHRGRNGAIAQ